ncbi:hypothetical protein CDV31_015933 [Fusarium ambrosium]|uniref:Uncharacterized protein n=1 Tax=Fusarium ambrosium TaxID=131363 RepID=A0A428SH70_9HYPO|nr:hypothetical protein CDV31_015933 [Fusarium ambrosium]
MTSTSTDALAASTPGFTTQTTPLHIPRFTPRPGCINASNIFYETDECSWGTGIGLYKPDTHTCTFFGIDSVWDDQNNDCLPGYRDIATECPVQYTAASTWDWEKSNGETTREIFCCPTVYDFKWRGMATLTDNRGSSASLTISSCVARSPSFAGNSPWALNISYWSTSGETVVKAGTTAEFDPETDKLVASVATIAYVINKRGSTCVPDCSTPYTGGVWPPPVTEPSSTPPPLGKITRKNLVTIKPLSLATAFSVGASAATSDRCQPQNCTDVHVFLVRGTGEAYPGDSISIAKAICDDWKDYSWSSVQYPASFRPTYCSSLHAGIETLSTTGGQTFGDYLGGGGGHQPGATGCKQETNPPLDPESEVGQKIVAALMYGSPRHVANQTSNVLVGERFQSSWPREGKQLESLNRWTKVLRDYGNMEDPACAGGDNWMAHTSYFKLYSADAAQFVRFALSS